MKTIYSPSKNLILGHFDNLSESSRKSRFGFQPIENRIKSYVNDIDQTNDITIGLSDSNVLIGFLHFAESNSIWDLGISIIDYYQNRGLGKQLLSLGMEAVIKRKPRMIVSLCDFTNHAIKKWCSQNSFKFTFEGSQIYAEKEMNYEECN